MSAGPASAWRARQSCGRATPAQPYIIIARPRLSAPQPIVDIAVTCAATAGAMKPHEPIGTSGGGGRGRGSGAAATSGGDTRSGAGASIAAGASIPAGRSSGGGASIGAGTSGGDARSAGASGVAGRRGERRAGASGRARLVRRHGRVARDRRVGGVLHIGRRRVRAGVVGGRRDDRRVGATRERCEQGQGSESKATGGGGRSSGCEHTCHNARRKRRRVKFACSIFATRFGAFTDGRMRHRDRGRGRSGADEAQDHRSTAARAPAPRAGA